MTGGVPLTGGAAVLARIRAQRQGSLQKAAAPAPTSVTVLYGSQTGTAREIARNISAEAVDKGFKAEAKSMDEVRLQGLSSSTTPIVVVVISSTGDGDAPDNALKAMADLTRAANSGQLNGIRFTLLGLGDSNYTRFMHVPRTVKKRFSELGATEFYPSVEADEVSGLDTIVDPWVEGLWLALKTALGKGSSAAPPATSAAPTRVPAPTPTATPVVATTTPAATSVATPAATPTTTHVTPAAASTVPPVQASTNGSATSLNAEAASTTIPASAIAVPRALATTISSTTQEAASDSAWVSVPAGWDLKGVPPLVPCNVVLHWRDAADEAKQTSPSTKEEKPLVHISPTGDYTPDAPFMAALTKAQLLTRPDSDRRVLHLEFDVTGSGIRFKAGDSVAVLPQNDESLVWKLLERLGVEGERVLEAVRAKGAAGPPLLPHLHVPCTLREAFIHSLDLTTPAKKSLLRMLGEHCSDPAQRRQLLYLTCSAGREQYGKLVLESQPSLLDLLNKFPSCSPPLEALLEALPPLAPRPYSLTNAPCCGENVLQVALSVVNVPTLYGPKHGVATTWLDRLARPLLEGAAPWLPVHVPVCMRKGGSFCAPASLDRHWIMVGPGTGVAPFRGFLQERRQRMQNGEVATGEAWLFFGCRRADEDFLYRQDLESFAADGTLTSLQVAFSREGSEKQYVQYLMKEHAEHIATMIREGAHVFVCGDGFKMAKDVHSTLVELLGDGGEQALTGMVRTGQYVRDIWS